MHQWYIPYGNYFYIKPTNYLNNSWALANGVVQSQDPNNPGTTLTTMCFSRSGNPGRKFVFSGSDLIRLGEGIMFRDLRLGGGILGVYQTLICLGHVAAAPPFPFP